jgi:hypothetical protein
MKDKEHKNQKKRGYTSTVHTNTLTAAQRALVVSLQSSSINF